MHNKIQFHVGNTSQSAASVYFTMGNGAKIVSAAGTFVGPHCKHARTLPASFKTRLSTHATTQQSIAETMIVDPCYWTPALPFTYDAKIQLQTEEGETIDYEGTLGMRQWHGAKNGFYLNFRRTVLRGYVCPTLDDNALLQARQQELTLLVDPAGQAIYQTADRMGVGLLVDLRNAGDSLSEQIRCLNWSPSVLLAILNAEQLTQLNKTDRPKQCLLAQSLTADSLHSEISETNPDVFAIELNAGEHPPAWLAKVEQPVLAVRQGGGGSQPPTPRHDCEVFQANLTPNSLAGYFVSL